MPGCIDGDCGDLWFRVGRQELLYGSERLISPLDWANTRRTFEGFKFFWQGQDWNVDFFATRPVIVDPIHFDSPDYEQEFFGAWGTYKGNPGHTFDLFAIQFNNARGANNFEFTTLGGRWLGSEGSWLWEARRRHAIRRKHQRQRRTRPALPPAASATNGPTTAGSRSSGAITTGPAAATCSARAKASTTSSRWPTSTWATWTSSAAATSSRRTCSSRCSRTRS